MNRSGSEAVLKRARQSVAGGDSSTMRVLPYHPALVIDAGEAARIFDVDGNVYIDLNMAYGPLLFGHRPDFLVAQVVEQLQQKGSQLGFPSELNAQVAEKIKRLFPSIDLLRFANSGTEAIASAIRVARHHTRRSGIVLFEGHYHGWSEAVFHKYHAPLEELNPEPGAPALPGTSGMNGNPHHAYMAPWNDIEGLEHCLDRHRDEIGAVIMEPVMGNAGVIPPKSGYLEAVRTLTRRRDILLIFDEVITGLRIAPGGAQERYGVQPDITILSKALGGGVPIAALGGREEVMQPVAEGALFHVGVYSSNALVLAAADAVLTQLLDYTESIYTTLEARGSQLAEGISDILERYQIPHCVQRVGPMLTFYLTKDNVESLDDYRAVRRYGDFERYIAFQHALLDHGVYLHPNMFEPVFLSTAHSSEDLSEVLERIEECTKVIA